MNHIEPPLDPAFPPVEDALGAVIAEQIAERGQLNPEHLPAVSEGAALGRATVLLAVGTVASRILGFVQELLLAHFFGTQGGLVDAFQIAITVPRDLYDLTISGNVNSALIPVITEYATGDSAELWQLVNGLFTLLLLILGGLTLLLEVFAAPVVSIYRGTLTPEAMALTISLLRITTPALIFLGLFALFSSVLYAFKRFTAPAFGSAIFNGSVVAAILILAPVIGIERAAIGFVLGAVMQMGLQLVSLRKNPLRPLINIGAVLQSRGIRRIGLLYLPVAVSLIFDVLINRTFSYHLASQAGSGDIAYMNWATSLREFPMGLVGTAISIAVLPTLARQALDPAARQAFIDTFGQGIRLALTLILPATVGLFVLAGPLVGLLFEHGLFTATDTAITSLTLRLYLIGTPFAAVDLLLTFAFYARKDTVTPALIGIVSLIFYMIVALSLQGRYGFYALMIADSMKFLLHTVLSLFLLRRQLGSFGTQRLFLTVIKTMTAALLMGIAAFAVLQGLDVAFNTQAVREQAPVLLRFGLVLIPSFVGALIYIGLVYLFRIREFTWFIMALRQRTLRRRGSI